MKDSINKNINIVPVISYNANKDKYRLYKDNLYKSGVYRWYNESNDKSYVGSSKNLGNRLSIYYSKKAMLAKVKHSTSIIYSALLKHSNDNFTLDILEYCELDILTEREQYYIDILKPEYNILPAANSRIGSKHSLKTRALMSLKLKGVNNPSFGKTLSQEIRMKISKSLKSSVLVKNRFKIGPSFKPKRPDTLLKMSLRTHGVSVKILDKDNNIVKAFPTMTSAAKHFGISSTTISRIENKGVYNNFIFKFEPKDFRVWVYDSNKKLVKVFNNKEASKECNITNTSLHSYIKSGKHWQNKYYFYNIFNLANSQLLDKQIEERTYIKKPLTKETLLKLSLRTVGVNIKIFNKLGELENTFPTITSAAKYFGVSNKRISCIPNKGVFYDFTFEFKLNDTRVWVYNANKELIKVFNNTKEVSEWCNISRNPLNSYIRSGKLYKKKGFYFYNIKSKPS